VIQEFDIVPSVIGLKVHAKEIAGRTNIGVYVFL